MVTRRRGARGLTSGIRAGWLVAGGAAAGALVAGIHLAGSGHGAPVALGPAAPVRSAAPARPVTAPDTADRATAPTASPSPPATPPPPPAPPATARPVTAAVVLAPAPLGVQPPGLTEAMPAGSAFSPLVTFTVTATGRSAVTVGLVTTTDPGFRIVRDGCSRTRLPPGGTCSVTVQLVTSAPGRHTGALLVAVAGMRPASARLVGVVR